MADHGLASREVNIDGPRTQWSDGTRPRAFVRQGAAFATGCGARLLRQWPGVALAVAGLAIVVAALVER